jgi:hypothetical protein
MWSWKILHHLHWKLTPQVYRQQFPQALFKSQEQLYKSVIITSIVGAIKHQGGNFMKIQGQHMVGSCLGYQVTDV